MGAHRGRPKTGRPRRVSVAVLIDADQAEELNKFDNRSEIVRQALSFFLPKIIPNMNNKNEQKGFKKEAA